ncbi:MAG: nitroreductase family protein [Actinomycetota bacterium]
MEFEDVVRKRRMVRNFHDRPIPEETRDRILANAVRAPSAGFTQGWAFLVLEDSADRARFWNSAWPEQERTGPHTGITRAPLVIVPLASRGAYLARYAESDKAGPDQDPARWPVPYWDIDTGFASMLMLLTAVDKGLGALFFRLRGQDLGHDFGVPPEYHPIGALAFGYPAPDTPSPSLQRVRKPVQIVTHFGRW